MVSGEESELYDTSECGDGICRSQNRQERSKTWLGQQAHLPCLISAVFNLKALSSFSCSRASMQHESLPADAERQDATCYGEQK